MLKLNASFAKKVPTGQKFSSQSFLASIECELPAGQTEPQLRQKIHETFELVKASVEEEIAAQSTHESPQNQRRPQSPSGASGDKATNRQIQFILSLAKDRNQGLPELNKIASDQFKAPTIYELTKRDASKLVDQLKLAA